MGVGILMCFLGALAFGVAACVSKSAEKRNCSAPVLVTYLFGWSCAVMLARTLATGEGFHLPTKAVWAAVAFGICAAVAFLAFQTSISLGKVTVAWLMMNLSAGVPALVSVWVYQEKLTPLKLAAYAIACGAVACLFHGKRTEQKEASRSGGTMRGKEHLLWFALMVVILLTNGMSSFGLKMLTAMSLPGDAKFPYLTLWYGAGLVIIALPAVIKRVAFGSKELGWGLALALLSIGGQVAMAIALDSKVPGNVVFPVTIGGGILVVVIAGRLFFGERLNRPTTGGIALGFLATILLGIS